MKILKATTLYLSILLAFPLCSNAMNTDDKETEKATIHIYRPSRNVGFGWNFQIKANGEEIAKLKNGKKISFQMNPEQVSIQLKKNNVKLNLEPGRHYYLRASLTRNMLLGKPELVEVTESFAQSEL